MSLCLCVCVRVCLSCWFLSCVKSVWGVWGILGSNLTRGCCILSFMQFHALLHSISHNFYTNSCNFMQFWLFQPFLDQFQHVGYQNTCIRAENFNGDTFTNFHALPHIISRNFQAISRNFGNFSHFWANFNMLGINMHILDLKNSMKIVSHTFTHSITQFYAIFAQNYTILAILTIFGPILTGWV